MIGRSGERGSGISVLAARHDDDDDDLFLNSQFICCCIVYKNNYDIVTIQNNY